MPIPSKVGEIGDAVRIAQGELVECRRSEEQTVLGMYAELGV